MLAVFRATPVTAAIACAVVLTACTNGLFSRKTSSAATAGSGAATRPPVMIADIVKNNVSPDTDIDLVGDGTGAMGQFCPTVNDCTCDYNYLDSTGAQESVEFQPDYVERDLVRCPYTILIQKGAAVAQVRIKLVGPATYSNEMDFVTDGDYGSSDPTNAANYVKALRYQCRDIARIPHMLSSAAYDPFQSDDPEFTYPLDFYTGNVGSAVSQFSAQNSSQYVCPTNFEANDLAGVNLRVFSKAPLPNVPPASGGELIYDPSANPNPIAQARSVFYLSRSPTSVFTVPLNTYVAPTLGTTSDGSNGRPPVGWGAAPIPNGAGKETCPDSAAKPVGYQWVKLWLFRADLPARTYYKSTKFLQNSLEILCNPGLPLTYCGKLAAGATSNSTGGNTAFPNTAPYTNNTTVNGTTQLADRIFDPNPVCASLSAGANSGVGGAADGTDRYVHAATMDACSATVAQSQDPFGACNAGGSELLDAAPTAVNYDGQQGNARYDFLIVATPETVNTVDMRAANSTALPYIPYRFYTDADCATNDPIGAPPAGKCASDHLISYGLKQHDMTTNGDPPANDPNRVGSFPMCALQPVPK